MQHNKARPKKKRQEVLRHVIHTQKTSTHKGLIMALKKRGIEVTQSSISRDLSEIGIIKRGGYYYLPASLDEGKITPPPTSIETAGRSLIVLKTLPSMAPSLASVIDHQNIQGVIGTVAGDDTVFVAVSSEVSSETLSKRLKVIFKSKILKTKGGLYGK